MDYRIFNVRMVFRMRAYNYNNYIQGDWAHTTDSESAHPFLTRKNSNFFLCSPDGIRTLDLWVSGQSNALTTEAKPSPPVAGLKLTYSYTAR